MIPQCCSVAAVDRRLPRASLCQLTWEESSDYGWPSCDSRGRDRAGTSTAPAGATFHQSLVCPKHLSVTSSRKGLQTLWSSQPRKINLAAPLGEVSLGNIPVGQVPGGCTCGETDKSGQCYHPSSEDKPVLRGECSAAQRLGQVNSVRERGSRLGSAPTTKIQWAGTRPPFGI